MEIGDAILEVALAFDLVITSTYFKKSKGHLITYQGLFMRFRGLIKRKEVLGHVKRRF